MMNMYEVGLKVCFDSRDSGVLFGGGVVSFVGMGYCPITLFC